MKFIDPLIPKEHIGNIDRLREARTALLFGVIMLVNCFFWPILYVSLGLNSAAYTFLIWGPIYAATPVVFWWTRSISFTGQWITAFLLVCLTTIGVFSGGYTAVATWWVSMVPLVGMLLSGYKAGAFWLVATCITVTINGIVTLSGISYPEASIPLSAHIVVISAGQAVLTCTLYGLGYLFEAAKNRTLDTLNKTNDSMRFILDNVQQGFITVNRDGEIVGHASEIISTWFGNIEESDIYIWNVVAKIDTEQADLMEICWEQLYEDIMPLDLTLEQLPRCIKHSESYYEFSYEVTRDKDGEIHNIILCISDITSRVAAENAEAEKKETQEIIQRILSDRDGFMRFYNEASGLVTSIESGEGNLYALAHTLKGNSGIFGIHSVARICHKLEDELQQDGAFSASGLEKLRGAWTDLEGRISFVLDGNSDALQIPMSQLILLKKAVERQDSKEVILKIISSWQFEPVRSAFSRIEQQVIRIARALDKLPVKVTIEDNNVLIDPGVWQPLWSSSIHVVRNAIDHGLEGPDRRLACGKPSEATIMLRARCLDNATIVEIADDGAGINYEKLVARARSKGVELAPDQPRSDLLFMDGLSSREQASEYSGRGVGMGAFRQACIDLGGRVEVFTELGKGTTFRVTIPRSAAAMTGLGSEDLARAAS